MWAADHPQPGTGALAKTGSHASILAAKEAGKTNYLVYSVSIMFMLAGQGILQSKGVCSVADSQKEQRTFTKQMKHSIQDLMYFPSPSCLSFPSPLSTVWEHHTVKTFIAILTFSPNLLPPPNFPPVKPTCVHPLSHFPMKPIAIWQTCAKTWMTKDGMVSVWFFPESFFTGDSRSHRASTQKDFKQWCNLPWWWLGIWSARRRSLGWDNCFSINTPGWTNIANSQTTRGLRTALTGFLSLYLAQPCHSSPPDLQDWCYLLHLINEMAAKLHNLLKRRSLVNRRSKIRPTFPTSNKVFFAFCDPSCPSSDREKNPSGVTG